MIRVIKEGEGTWCVWNTQNQKCADIVKINEYNPLGKNKAKYRVDFNGFTISSMIDNFQKAKGKAIKAVKGGS